MTVLYFWITHSTYNPNDFLYIVVFLLYVYFHHITHSLSYHVSYQFMSNVSLNNCTTCYCLKLYCESFLFCPNVDHMYVHISMKYHCICSTLTCMVSMNTKCHVCSSPYTGGFQLQHQHEKKLDLSRNHG